MKVSFRFSVTFLSFGNERFLNQGRGRTWCGGKVWRGRTKGDRRGIWDRCRPSSQGPGEGKDSGTTVDSGTFSTTTGLRATASVSTRSGLGRPTYVEASCTGGTPSSFTVQSWVPSQGSGGGRVRYGMIGVSKGGKKVQGRDIDHGASVSNVRDGGSSIGSVTKEDPECGRSQEISGVNSGWEDPGLA